MNTRRMACAIALACYALATPLAADNKKLDTEALKATAEPVTVVEVWGLKSSGIDGQIEKLPKPGQRIKKGEKIVVLCYVPDYAANLLAALDQAKATVKYKELVASNARQQADRVIRSGRGSSDADIVRAKHAAPAAYADLEAAKAAAKVAEGNSTPFEPVAAQDLTVLEVNAKIGSTAAPVLPRGEKPWVVLADMATMKVVIRIARAHIERIDLEKTTIIAGKQTYTPASVEIETLAVRDGKIAVALIFRNAPCKGKLPWSVLPGDAVNVVLSLK